MERDGGGWGAAHKLGAYWKLPERAVDDAAAEWEARAVSRTRGGAGTVACSPEDKTRPGSGLSGCRGGGVASGS